MGTVYAIANQKGGVGKTTTAVNVAACIAEAGYPTLLVDVDPQANATVALGRSKHLDPNLYDVLRGEATVDEAIVATEVEGLSLLPASPDLAARRTGGYETHSRRCATASTTSCSTAPRRSAR